MAEPSTPTLPQTGEETARELLAAVDDAAQFIEKYGEQWRENSERTGSIESSVRADRHGAMAAHLRAILSALGPPPTEVREDENILCAQCGCVTEEHRQSKPFNRLAIVITCGTCKCSENDGKGCSARSASDATPPMRDREAIDLPRDKYGETAIDRLRDHAENGTMEPQFRNDLRTLLSLSPPCDCLGAVEAEREACAQLAEKWRDENKVGAAKARKRASALGDNGMADMLDGAAIECNAIAQEIRARTALQGPGGEGKEADMVWFAASDAACYLFPGEDQLKERSAFCDGAAYAVSSIPDTPDREAALRGAEYLRRIGEGGWGDGDIADANYCADAIIALSKGEVRP